MAFFSDLKSYTNFVQLSLLLILLACLVQPSASNFHKTVDVNWGNGRGKIVEGGRGLTLSLDNSSGSGFQSKKEYLFGRFDMQLKFVPGNSAGTVTTFFLASHGPNHDEIDFEFLGNSSGEPYTVHTNVYTQGKGEKEQQFRLWFDPAKAFHTYSVVWNPHRIIFMVDNIPLRVLTNHEAYGIPFPTSKPMRVKCSLWNADDWATQGGRVKTEWAKGPFVAHYRNFKIDACEKGSSSCGSNSSTSGDSLNKRKWWTHELDSNDRNRLRWVQQKHMIYNYCTDKPRFPRGIPSECKRSRF
ncbi:hypothetical protein CASFOL_002133 [Castilleja foliolosa]|uniref:Xyloglucan endotransglucosylase/hydrolase n=1 Tax=Castilleja foliolosa TaxID=1961234 RepID=A0ABD3EDT0_9LAMI